MKCFNCNANISNVDKYCPRCGTVFDNGDVERLGDRLENRLLNIYLSKKRFNCSFSLGYLIFNFWYALYRKMYYEAILGALADGLLVFMVIRWKGYLFSSMGFNALLILFSFLVGVVICVYYILKYDEIYIVRVKGYINKLIRDYGTDNIKLLEEKCEKDSKGNLLVPVLVIILIILIFAI